MSLSGLSRIPENSDKPLSDIHRATLDLIGDSVAMQRVRLQIERIGPHFRTVLVRGETGTGKELVARALHARSNGAEDPFVVCHAPMLADERDLVSTLMERASEGTLFFDGVEEMSVEGQKKLLRILDQRTGLRTITSTTQDLRVMAAAGVFRHDLYHRLAMIEISLDPLRRRVEDIPSLAVHFLEKFASQYAKRIDAIAPHTLERLLVHAWPGNVRELENVIHNGVLQCVDAILGLDDLPSLLEPAPAIPSHLPQQPGAVIRLQDVIDRHVLRVLQECSGNKVRAAEMLGISRSTLYRMLETSSSQTIQPQN